MKLKIEKEFFDKYTDVKYTVGEEIDFEDARAAELLGDDRALVSKVEEAEVSEAPKPKKATKK